MNKKDNDFYFTKSKIIQLANKFLTDFDKNQYEYNLDGFTGWFDENRLSKKVELRRRRSISNCDLDDDWELFLSICEQRNKERQIEALLYLIDYLPDNFRGPGRIYIQDSPIPGIRGDSIVALNMFNIQSLLTKDKLIAIPDSCVNHSLFPFLLSLKKPFIIFPSVYLRRFFSYVNSYPIEFLSKFYTLPYKNRAISIDLNVISFIGMDRACLEMDRWWGPKFKGNLRDIEIGVCVHVTNETCRRLYNVERTEFYWYMRNNCLVCEIEELLLHDKPNEDENYACKYLHSRVNSNFETIEHCDGAIRIYTKDQYKSRLACDLKKFRKAGSKNKVWRIDNDVPVDDWVELTCLFFRGNHNVYEYFEEDE